MKHPLQHEIYDVKKTFEQNYAEGPFYDGDFPGKLPVPKTKIKLWDFEVNSRLGIPAGPLFNSNWLKFYAQFGFDVLVYKTVRSIEKPCNPFPNCLYVNPETQLKTDLKNKPELIVTREPEFVEDLTITNSFGIPAVSPSIWQEDLGKAHEAIGEGQLVITSITGTGGAEGRNLIDDFAYTAAMAKEAGAVIIEANYSCPNLCGGDAEGDLYTDPAGSAETSRLMRKAVGASVPLMIKIGNLPYQKLKEVVKANSPYVDGFAGINTIPAHVRTPDGHQALPGEGRLQSGICGAKIQSESQLFTENMVKIREELGGDFVICGVGGIMNEDDFQSRLETGADIAMSATAVMWDPWIAVRSKEKYQ